MNPILVTSALLILAGILAIAFRVTRRTPPGLPAPDRAARRDAYTP